ncbi:lactate utilization protein B [Gemmatimonadota bacterium]
MRTVELMGRPGLRDSVAGAAFTFDGRRRERYEEIDAEAWRRWAEGVKNHLLGRLPHYLAEADRHLRENGVRVHWASTAEEARNVVGEVVREYAIRRLVKAKSMLSEELEINPFLASRGVVVTETDLGEYILQLLEEPPSHIVAPAIHQRLEDVQALFKQELNTPPNAGPDELAAAARILLRQAFLDADAGMSGANFLVAETGTIALIENEGNIRLTTSAPPVHIALIGIEKLLPRFDDLAGFLQLTARAALGMHIGTFVSLIQGPRRPGETDGPESVHVVLVDNGRSSLLADPEAWEALRCVRCAACQNACPVYRQIGGHAWDWVYGGPIGSILAPALRGLRPSVELPYASTLCGACGEVCPVRIPIPELLHTWRIRSVDARLSGSGPSAALRVYAGVMRRPRTYRLASRLLRLVRGGLGGPLTPVVRNWRIGRGGLEPSPRTFRDLWRRGIR